MLMRSTQSLEDEDDRPVYEVVDEEEYRKRVAKRRHNDDFVVDDGTRSTQSKCVHVHDRVLSVCVCRWTWLCG